MSGHHCVIVNYFAHTNVGNLVMLRLQAYLNSPWKDSALCSIWRILDIQLR